MRVSVKDVCIAAAVIACHQIGTFALTLHTGASYIAADELAECPCADDEPRGTLAVAGNYECKHGPEFDPKCLVELKRLLGLLSPADTLLLSDAGVKFGDDTTFAQIFDIIAAGKSAAYDIALRVLTDVMNSGPTVCDPMRCAGINAVQGKECESYVVNWGAVCPKGMEGQCTRHEGTQDEKIRTELKTWLVEGKTRCTNTGTGIGFTLVKFCGNSYPVANCLSDACETLILAKPVVTITGKRLYCGKAVD